MNANKNESSRSLESFARNANATARKASNRLALLQYLISVALLTGSVLILAACGPASALQDLSKQLPPTPVSSAPASTVVVTVPTAAPTATLPPGVQGPLPNWKTLTSASYQYALSYPSDWSVTTEKVGTVGEAKNVERVTLKQPNYNVKDQFATITIEAAQRAYTTTEQCQGATVVVSGIKGCRRSLAKGLIPPQEIVLFQSPSAYFYVQLVYDDTKYVRILDQMLATWKFTTAAGPSPSAAPTDAGAFKSYQSDKYSYTVSYPVSWKIQVQTAGPSAPGEDRENVFLTSPGGGLPHVQILALKGAPPITGFEKCPKNLEFRGIPACSISLPGGQQPATQMLLFQRGDAYLHLAIQYETPSQLAVFDEIVRSFQFTSSGVSAPATPASWRSYRNDQGGFVVQYPSNWKFSELPPQNAGLLKSARIEGTEGGIELFWGTGLGGMCEENAVSKYIRVPAGQGGLQTCYSKDSKGMEQWNQISTPSLRPGFQARAWTKDARATSRELVLKVIASLNFDQP